LFILTPNDFQQSAPPKNGAFLSKPILYGFFPRELYHGKKLKNNVFIW